MGFRFFVLPKRRSTQSSTIPWKPWGARGTVLLGKPSHRRPVLPGPAPPPRTAPPRTVSPVVCPGFGLDSYCLSWISTGAPCSFCSLLRAASLPRILKTFRVPNLSIQWPRIRCARQTHDLPLELFDCRRQPCCKYLHRHKRIKSEGRYHG